MAINVGCLRTRLCRWGIRLSRAQRLHLVVDLVSCGGIDHEALTVRAMPRKADLDGVLARGHIESLERPVEIVHDAGVVAVDIDFRRFRLDLDSDGSRLVGIADLAAGVGSSDRH
jgi:hypothetical protein